MKAGIASVLLVLVSSVLSGCVIGERRPTLYYPAKAEQGVIPAASAAAKPAAKPVQIVLRTFDDQRSDKKTVGTTRNGFGMKMADVTPVNSVPEWVQVALRKELQDAGYEVVTDAKSDDQASNRAVVTGDILNVYCDMYFNYTGQVSLVARVSRSGKEVMNKHYSGEGSAGVAWAATEESYAQSLALALAAAIKPFIVELDKNLSSP